jgi:hypothetical protein
VSCGATLGCAPRASFGFDDHVVKPETRNLCSTSLNRFVAQACVRALRGKKPQATPLCPIAMPSEVLSKGFALRKKSDEVVQAARNARLAAEIQVQHARELRKHVEALTQKGPAALRSPG